MFRRSFIQVGILAGIMSSIPVSALIAEERWFTGLVDGVAVGGYDPVAYFTQGEPRRGDPAIAATHDGATWYFSSVENREAFLADPARYAPQYGGYCAYAVSQGYTAKGEPEIWDIVDGKLYLNYDANIQRRWQRDVPGFIASAEEEWPRLLQ